MESSYYFSRQQMKKSSLLLLLFLLVFTVKAREDISIRFSNDYKEVYHLSLIIYTPDGKIQTRVSNLNPEETKTYSLPVGTAIFIADKKQEAFAMRGNDIKSTGVKPYIVLKNRDAQLKIKASSITHSK